MYGIKIEIKKQQQQHQHTDENRNNVNRGIDTAKGEIERVRVRNEYAV